MATTDRDLSQVRVGDRVHWESGPPHTLFRELRASCPVHWTEGITEWPEEEGFWSITRPMDIQTVSRDFRTYSSERGGITMASHIFPLDLVRAMFIGMDPPRHDRIKTLFQAGFTPRRIAGHEDAIRTIVRARLDALAGRERCDLVADFAQPVVSRVIGSFMGTPPEDDAIWARIMNSSLSVGDDTVSPGGVDGLINEDIPEVFRRVGEMIATRREHPTDDLTSVLVHAEIEGQTLSEPEIVMGFFLLVAAGNDSTKATYCSAMRALMDHADQRQALLDDPSLVPAAVEEALRMFPAFNHFRRTATRDVELGGETIHEGEKVVLWYASSGRDEDRYTDPDHFNVHRNPEHQAFGAGGRHFCLGAALARLELTIMLEETLARYPQMQPDGEPAAVLSTFLGQLRTLPVRLMPVAEG